MRQKDCSMNVLFIASNIPTPVTKRNNAIILTIAKKNSEYCNVEILYPRPYVPFFLGFIEKYRRIYKETKWQDQGKTILAFKYARLPIKGIGFKLVRFFFNRSEIRFHNDIIPDIVHAHYIFADGSLALLIKEKYDIPYVVTARGDDVRKIVDLDSKSFDYKHASEILSNASKVFCLNHYQKNIIESRFAVSAHVVPHGIDQTEIIQPRVTNTTDKIIVSVVGELIEQKRILWVINAVKEYGGDTEIELNVFGDGPLKSTYESASKGYNNISIKGRVPRDTVMSALTESDIFCLPSEKETFGLVYLEAAAKGNAIIARHQDGVWKVFDEDTEILYANDESSFKTLFYKLVENDKMRKSLIINSNKKVQQFTWKKISKVYYDNYSAILSSNPK